MHTHETVLQNGQQVIKCEHTHQPSRDPARIRCSNRLSVQKYRNRKKNEIQEMRFENERLKARVEELEDELRKALNRPPPSEELLYLQNLFRQLQGLFGIHAD